MIRRIISAGILALLTVGATPVFAQFLASDLIYVPAAAHNVGADESVWRSDAFITNAEEESDIDVAIVYLPTGLNSNSRVFYSRDTWLGGTEGDGFGYVNPDLASIPPGGTVVLNDILGEYWVGQTEVAATGALVVFAYESGSLEDDGNRVVKNSIVNTRIFNQTTIWVQDEEDDTVFEEVPATYGMTMPGVPWYNLADPSAVDEDVNFGFFILNGAAATDEFRYNLGILNASDPLTSITVVVEPFRGNGEPFPDINGENMRYTVNMKPSTHVQFNNVMASLFGIVAAPEDVSLHVTLTTWSSTNANPIPAMTTYGAIVDNRTNDPVAVLPAFAYPYNVECQWEPPGGGEETKNGASVRRGSRPLEIPAR